jgi:hypothetical protein
MQESVPEIRVSLRKIGHSSSCHPLVSKMKSPISGNATTRGPKARNLGLSLNSSGGISPMGGSQEFLVGIFPHRALPGRQGVGQVSRNDALGTMRRSELDAIEQRRHKNDDGSRHSATHFEPALSRRVPRAPSQPDENLRASPRLRSKGCCSLRQLSVLVKEISTALRSSLWVVPPVPNVRCL